MKIDKGWRIIIGLFVASAMCFIIAAAMEPKPIPKIATIKQLQKEVTFLRDANYSLQEKQAGLQYREDMRQLYIEEFGTGKITKEEMASKIEAIEPISPLLEIKKHKLEWEND